MTVDRSATPGDLTIAWAASCASGGEDYGIYEGTIGTWYGHSAIDCSDGGTALIEDVTPSRRHRQLKVQRGAFFADLPGALREVRREPPMMAAAMILLAGGCIALSLAVVTGLRTPWLVDAARQVLLAGALGS